MATMLASRLSLLLVLVLLVDPCLSTATGSLVAVYRAVDTRTNCTLIHLDYETGKLVHVANVSSACLDFNPMQTSRPQTALDTSRLSSGFPMLLYFSGSGSALHGIDVTTGAVSVVAPAPAKYGFVIGLQACGGSVYLVTVQHVFELTRSGFIQLADLSGAKLGELAQVACGNKSLLISGSTTLTVVSLPAGDLVTKSLSNVSNILDLQYDAGSGSLIALANYKLFHLDIVTCDATFLLDIPDGDGYPSISAVSGSTFLFADFQHVFSVDVPAASIESKVDFDGYFCNGNFQFVKGLQLVS